VLQLRAARAERDLAAAELRLRQRGYQEEDIAVARADLDRAEAELAAAQRDLDRFEALLDAGSGTAKTRDDAQARRDVAAASAAAGRQRWRKLRAGYREEEKAAAGARLEATAARIAAIEQQVKDATVTSPTEGVVTEKLVEAGEIVAPGSPLCVVTDLADAWLTAYVPESQLSRIRLGQQAQVSTDDGVSRTGHVAWVSQRAEFTPKNIQTREERVKLVFKIKVRLPNDDGLFKPGMPAEARVTAAVEGARARADGQ
jgi:HlyD family secretion protein